MSNLIKFSHYVDVYDKKVISAVQRTVTVSQGSTKDRNQDKNDSEQTDQISKLEIEAQKIKEQIIKDAEETAEAQIKQAMDEVKSIKKQAEIEINAWWEEKRKLDQQRSEDAKSEGFDQGYQEGLIKSEAAVREEYSNQLIQAQSIIEQAHHHKQQIIQEAEPFLIQLSCSISEKIIHRQLSVSKEWVMELIQSALTLKREQGVITLCVSPDQFTHILDAREELSFSIDSQAELQILADSSVKDHGCLIRYSMGSIDARIDTQLTEIKSVLLRIASGNGETIHHED